MKRRIGDWGLIPALIIGAIALAGVGGGTYGAMQLVPEGGTSYPRTTTNPYLKTNAELEVLNSRALLKAYGRVRQGYPKNNTFAVCEGVASTAMSTTKFQRFVCTVTMPDRAHPIVKKFRYVVKTREVSLSP